MKSQHVVDSVCCNAALSACEEAGRWQQALQIFQEHEIDVKGDANSYLLLMNALADGKQAEKAWAVHRRMLQDGVAPTAASCSAAVRAGGAWQQQLELLQEMRCFRRRYELNFIELNETIL